MNQPVQQRIEIELKFMSELCEEKNVIEMSTFPLMCEKSYPVQSCPKI